MRERPAAALGGAEGDACSLTKKLEDAQKAIAELELKFQVEVNKNRELTVQLDALKTLY